jgi:hypothetical protein
MPTGSLAATCPASCCRNAHAVLVPDAIFSALCVVCVLGGGGRGAVVYLLIISGNQGRAAYRLPTPFTCRVGTSRGLVRTPVGPALCAGAPTQLLS